MGSLENLVVHLAKGMKLYDAAWYFVETFARFDLDEEGMSIVVTCDGMTYVSPAFRCGKSKPSKTLVRERNASTLRGKWASIRTRSIGSIYKRIINRMKSLYATSNLQTNVVADNNCHRQRGTAIVPRLPKATLVDKPRQGT